MLSEECLRRLAAACFANAGSLHADAVLLSENGRYARALALAVICVEEFAKSVIYTVAALLPDERSQLPLRLDGHEMKHQAADAAEAAQIVNDEGWLVAAQEGYPLDSTGRLRDMFQSLVEWGLRALIDRDEAKRFYGELRGRLVSERKDWESIVKGFNDPSFLLDPDRKNAGFYVDPLPDGTVLAPDRVEDRHAASMILGLEWYLDEYRALPAVLGDDARWADFYAKVRRHGTSG